MFRITENLSSVSLTLYLAKITSMVHTHAQRVTICCHNTDYVHVKGHDKTFTVILAKYCTRLPDDGSFVIRNMLEHF